MNLIIVESPTKSRTLASFLNKDYRVIATMGHIRDLPPKKLGVDVKHNFKPHYLLVPGKRKIVKKLKEEAKKAKKILLATDPDREGEAIAWHVSQILARQGNTSDGGRMHSSEVGELARIAFHEITKSAIEKALVHPDEINMQLVNAQQARRILDRLVGYKLSPLLWRKIRRGLSAGRVQSVAVRLIVDREREIEKFVPQEYWEIMAELRRHLGGKKPGASTFLAKIIKKNGKKIKIKDKTTAEEVVAELKKSNYEVFAVEQKEILQSPPAPFRTSTLQQKAAQTLRFSSKRTMRVAQSLYEKGLITYHRTDSVVLSRRAIAQIRQYINSSYGEKYLPAKARIYKTKSKVAQEAHEAIRPTEVNLKFKMPLKRDSFGIENLKLKIGRDESRLYDLIWKRAIASQMKEAIWNQTRVQIQAVGEKNIYLLLVEGRVIKFDGWLAANNGVKRQKSKAKNEKLLPELKKGDDLDLIKIISEQKFTQPPPRYTEATLIKALEERGIGRPSTYAPIISTIQARQYVEKTEGKFAPTSLGEVVNDFLLEYFPDVFDYHFTAKMENELDEIANGKRKWVTVVKNFYQPFEKKLLGVTEVAERVQVPTEATEERCPKCKEGQVVIRVGKFGKFLSCSRFPECHYTAPYTPKLEGVSCPQCGGDVIIRKTKKGKQFYGCANWPQCNWASWRKPRKIQK